MEIRPVTQMQSLQSIRVVHTVDWISTSQTPGENASGRERSHRVDACAATSQDSIMNNRCVLHQIPPSNNANCRWNTAKHVLSEQPGPNRSNIGTRKQTQLLHTHKDTPYTKTGREQLLATMGNKECSDEMLSVINLGRNIEHLTSSHEWRGYVPFYCPQLDGSGFLNGKLQDALNGSFWEQPSQRTALLGPRHRVDGYVELEWWIWQSFNELFAGPSLS